MAVGRVRTTWPTMRPRVEAVPVRPAWGYHGHRPYTVWYERWIVQEGACALCLPLAGEIFPEGVGLQPPLHRHCRCRRQRAYWVRYSGSGWEIARGSS